MSSSTGPPPPFLDQFLAAAESVARARPEVDVEIARELLAEAAVMLHDGLAFDGLDEHDTDAVVGFLCLDLVAVDPEAAVRTRSRTVVEAPGDLHEPDAVARSCLIAASILRL